MTNPPAETPRTGLTIDIPVLVELGPSAAQITEAAAELALRRLREALAGQPDR